MAQILEGENQGGSRGFICNAPPRLPPKFPVNRGSSPSEIDAPFYNNQMNVSPVQHMRTPSHDTELQEQPFWLNELLDDSEGPSRRGSHRRSASDSFTYLENPRSLYRFSNIAEEDESECNASLPCRRLGNEDSDQLTDLLDEIQQLQNQQNLPISARTQPINCKSDVSNANKLITSRNVVGDSQDQLVFGPKHERVKDFFLHESVIGGSTSLGSHGEGSADPKQAKRVLSNRQSAQRSRVRKLQYIAELERIVNSLQMDVSSLSTQMLYIQHQQAILDMDNSALKQRITFCLQEKNIKDSENETLINDVRRLQKMSEFQVLHQQQKHKQQLQRRNIHRHSSLPSDFAVQMQQFSESNAGSRYSPSDSIAGLMKDMASITFNETASTSEAAKDGGRTSSLEGGNASASSSIR